MGWNVYTLCIYTIYILNSLSEKQVDLKGGHLQTWLSFVSDTPHRSCCRTLPKTWHIESFQQYPPDFPSSHLWWCECEILPVWKHGPPVPLPLSAHQSCQCWLGQPWRHLCSYHLYWLLQPKREHDQYKHWNQCTYEVINAVVSVCRWTAA